MTCIKPHEAPGCQCKATVEFSWSDSHILLSSLGLFLFISCLEVHHKDVLRFLFGATLGKLNLTAAIALWSPVCSSSASLTSDTRVLFHSVAGMEQENPNSSCSVEQGSHHSEEHVLPWRPQLHVQLQREHLTCSPGNCP